jgi:hypothetical protein
MSEKERRWLCRERRFMDEDGVAEASEIGTARLQKLWLMIPASGNRNVRYN